MAQPETQININMSEIYDMLCPSCKAKFAAAVGKRVIESKKA